MLDLSPSHTNLDTLDTEFAFFAFLSTTWVFDISFIASGSSKGVLDFLGGGEDI